MFKRQVFARDMTEAVAQIGIWISEETRAVLSGIDIIPCIGLRDKHGVLVDTKWEEKILNLRKNDGSAGINIQCFYENKQLWIVYDSPGLNALEESVDMVGLVNSRPYPAMTDPSYLPLNQDLASFIAGCQRTLENSPGYYLEELELVPLIDPVTNKAGVQYRKISGYASRLQSCIAVGFDWQSLSAARAAALAKISKPFCQERELASGRFLLEVERNEDDEDIDIKATPIGNEGLGYWTIVTGIHQA